MSAAHHHGSSQPHSGGYLSCNGAWGLLIALIGAFFFALWLLPAGFITGAHPYWLAQNEDITVYQAGFNAFFREPWQWPLWRISSLNWPESTSATFVDILPLYAALLKLLAPANWFPFNPFGYWVLLCILLQGLGAWWVLREAEIPNWLALVTLVLLLVSFPAWLVRMGHISLMSHWIITFAYALYLRSDRKQRFSAIGWTTLLSIAFMLNIYLCVMAAIVCASDAIRCVLRGQFCRVLLWTITAAALLAMLAWATIWPLPAATGSPDAGFGRYAMNLLAPFTGCAWFDVSKTLPAMLLPALGGLGFGGCWLQPQSMSAEQVFEGFNYLGLGLMLLIAVAFVSAIKYRAHPRSAPRTAWTLPVFLLLVAAYALSNQIHFGTTVLTEWTVPAWAASITGQFRASGRFFWLVGYALIIFSVIRIARYAPKPLMVGTFASVLLLQTADVWPYLQQIRHLQPKANANALNPRAWNQAISENTATLYYFPKFKCAKQSDFFNTLLPVMQHASERRFNINTAYVARYTPPCDTESADIKQSNPANSVYVFSVADYNPETISILFPADWAIRCQQEDFALICQQTPVAKLLH